jgi:hypothetical protein
MRTSELREQLALSARRVVERRRCRHRGCQATASERLDDDSLVDELLPTVFADED